MQECIAAADTCYYGFEANPQFTPALTRLEVKLRQQRNLRVRLFTSTAFNVAGGEADFFVETIGDRPSVSSTLDGSRSTEWHDTELKQWRVNHSAHMTDRAQRVRVASTDAGQFIDSLVASSDFVAVKLDIEGSEFTLLPTLLHKHHSATCAVQLWAIEFHERSSPAYTHKARGLQERLEQCRTGSVLLNWH